MAHSSQIVKIPSQISDEEAVLIEPTAVALHAVLRKIPQPGDNVLIIGAGIIGLLILHIDLNCRTTKKPSKSSPIRKNIRLLKRFLILIKNLPSFFQPIGLFSIKS